MEPLGQGRPRCRGGAWLGTVSGGQRADQGRLLADGVGNRQQRAPAVVQPAVAGRRVVEPIVGRLRQPLHRPAGCDAVIPSDAVDSVAAAGHRNANHRKDSGAGPPARGDPSRSGSAVRCPPGHRHRQSAGSRRGHQPDGFGCAGSPTANRRAHAVRSRPHLHSRPRPAWWWCRCGSLARPRRCSSG